MIEKQGPGSKLLEKKGNTKIAARARELGTRTFEVSIMPAVARERSIDGAPSYMLARARALGNVSPAAMAEFVLNNAG